MDKKFQNRLGALTEELQAIRGLAEVPGTEQALHKLAADQKLCALCLSGGGVRSAAFCLGALQSLASARLLAQFDYLSTVSGGGYIGSFLQMLISRLGVSGAQSELARVTAPPELASLRNYTNYLSPGGGIFSLNTWAGIVLYLRNVLLNFVVYLPLLMLPVLGAIVARTSVWAIGHSMIAKAVTLALAVLALAVGTFATAKRLPDHRQNQRTGVVEYAGNAAVVAWVLWPALGYAALASLSLGLVDRLDAPRLPLWSLIVAYVLGLGAGYGAAWVTAGSRSDQAPKLYRHNAGAWVCATFVSAGIVCLGWWLLSFVGASQEPQVVTVAGPLWFLIAISIHSTVFVGVRRESAFFDLDREWLARASALKLRAGLVWAGFSFACLSVTWFLAVRGQTGSWAAWVVSGGAIGSGGIAAWLGQQATAKIGALISMPDMLQPILGKLLPVLSGIFILGVIAALGRSADLIDGAAQDFWQAHWPRSFTGAFAWPILVVPPVFALLLALLVFGFINVRVNVNRYSMHAVYRNRLSRSFLGTARAHRRPDPFTDFDPDDNVPLYRLAGEQGGRKLFPVLNLTLNLTHGGAAAWSERMAMAFTATPFACGAPLLPRFGEDRHAAPTGAYWATRYYAGHENRGDHGPSNGLSLATAMTISGAAVSPNWGYHSSPLTAFVMTLFNVRLGAWLPNPGSRNTPKEMNLAIPDRSLSSLVGDLSGMAGDTGKSIYLSDGGHFENLGLYEMLRRRCHSILVIDAGQDENCTFEDLGNALRKSSIDMGISVNFPKEMLIFPRGNTDIGKALGYAVGMVEYPDKGRPTGTIIYLKPTLLTDVPKDVLAFANLDNAFPHDSTADQFFNEGRFESYRSLGAFQMAALITALLESTLSDDATPPLDGFFAQAAKTISPAPSGCAQSV